MSCGGCCTWCYDSNWCCVHFSTDMPTLGPEFDDILADFDMYGDINSGVLTGVSGAVASGSGVNTSAAVGPASVTSVQAVSSPVVSAEVVPSSVVAPTVPARSASVATGTIPRKGGPPVPSAVIDDDEKSEVSSTSNSTSSGDSVDPNVRLYCVVCEQVGHQLIYFRNLEALVAHMAGFHSSYFGKNVDLRKKD